MNIPMYKKTFWAKTEDEVCGMYDFWKNNNQHLDVLHVIRAAKDEQNWFIIVVFSSDYPMEAECTCNPINGTACPSCVESNKVRYPVIPIEGEL